MTKPNVLKSYNKAINTDNLHLELLTKIIPTTLL